MSGVRHALGEAGPEELWPILAEAEAAFQRAGNEAGLARVGILKSLLFSQEGDEEASIDASKRAVEHAEVAGDSARVAEALSFLADSYLLGKSPVPLAVAEIEGYYEQTRDWSAANHLIAGALAHLLAMAGNFARARQLLRERRDRAAERGVTRYTANVAYDGMVELLAGDGEAAVAVLRPSWERYRSVGDRSQGGLIGALLGEALLVVGSVAEASTIRDELAGWIDGWDPSFGARVQLLTARIDARRGAFAEAKQAAEAAIEILDKTEYLHDRGQARIVLAEVLACDDRMRQAHNAGLEALALFEEKGNVVSAAKARKMIGELEGGPPG